MATRVLSDGGPDGTKLGRAASDLIALYGGTCASQRASSVQATSLISAYTATSASALIGALLLEIASTLQSTGMWKGGA
jgi:hypothetical protein